MKRCQRTLFKVISFTSPHDFLLFLLPLPPSSSMFFLSCLFCADPEDYSSGLVVLSPSDSCVRSTSIFLLLFASLQASQFTFPQLFIGDSIWQKYSKDSFKASIDRGKNFPGDQLSGFASIQQYYFSTAAEYS